MFTLVIVSLSMPTLFGLLSLFTLLDLHSSPSVVDTSQTYL
jgi:hypothetical protein